MKLLNCLCLHSVLISPSQSSEHSLNYIPNIQTVQVILQSYIVPFLRILRTFTFIVSLCFSLGLPFALMNVFLLAPGSLKVMVCRSICCTQEEKRVSVMPAYIINKKDHTHGTNLSLINNASIIRYNQSWQ